MDKTNIPYKWVEVKYSRLLNLIEIAEKAQEFYDQYADQMDGLEYMDDPMIPAWFDMGVLLEEYKNNALLVLNADEG